jgi:HlyD family secretion protein
LEKLERKIKGVKDDRMRQRLEEQILQLRVTLANQQITVDNATYKLNSLDAATDPLDISVVEARLHTAQLQLAAAEKEFAELQAGPGPGVIASAEARLKSAQAEWDRLKDGPDPDEIARLEAQVEKTRLTLEITREKATIFHLVAPIDGTVIALYASPGDRFNLGMETNSSDTSTGSARSEVEMFEALIFGNQNANDNNSGTLITIADLGQPLVEAAVDETDFAKVALGYPVEVSFEAFPGETFNGTIIEVSPQLETVSNTQGVRILVRLDADSYAKPTPLPIGLNASIDVIAGKAINAVLIPVEALVNVSIQQSIVYVIENGEIQPREVTVGLVDFTSAEITAGIEAGEVVVINDDPTSGH